MNGWNYNEIKTLLQDISLPAMLVDLDILDKNTRNIAEIVEQSGKKLRIASKSIRVVSLLKRIMEVGGASFQGVMCFCTQEAHFLASQGFDDLLIAYPTVQTTDLDLLWELTQAGRRVTLMVDTPPQMERINAYWEQRSTETDEESHPLRICLDIDMSYRPLGQHLGVQRSSIRTLDDVGARLMLLRQCPQLKLVGLMGYEAQIAGLGDQSPFSPLMNPIKKMLKQRSIRDVSQKRQRIMDMLQTANWSLDFFNGGGTGSLRSTTEEPWITEVTAGSGFLQSHLFDYYRDNQNQPAFCFALQATRQPQTNIITCHSGGFIASGEISPDKAPIPFLPEGLSPLPHEGFGEVQTPLRTPSKLSLQPGDPVLFRPAKSGEIAERFHHYYLKQGDAIVDVVPTYRGMGQCFF